MITVWRHPKPQGVSGRCIGRTDVPVDHRKAKRLAHRIRREVRRAGGARTVITSPLRRGADVGRWLARWGWEHHIDARLSELDFGTWDGQRWDAVGADAVDAWCVDFATHPPGGGESVAALLARCAEFLAEAPSGSVVGHAGWISAACWLAASPRSPPEATDWPPAVGYGAARVIAGNASQ